MFILWKKDKELGATSIQNGILIVSFMEEFARSFKDFRLDVKRRQDTIEGVFTWIIYGYWSSENHLRTIIFDLASVLVLWLYSLNTSIRTVCGMTLFGIPVEFDFLLCYSKFSFAENLLTFGS